MVSNHSFTTKISNMVSVLNIIICVAFSMTTPTAAKEGHRLGKILGKVDSRRIAISADLEEGSVVEEDTMVKDSAYFGPQSRAGPHTYIGERSRLEEHTKVDDHVKVEADVTFGPFTHVEDNAIIGNNVFTHKYVHIAAFAELKSYTNIGLFSKIDHAAKIGGIIGSRTYIGVYVEAENVYTGHDVRVYFRAVLPIGMDIGDNWIVIRSPETSLLFAYLRGRDLNGFKAKAENLVKSQKNFEKRFPMEVNSVLDDIAVKCRDQTSDLMKGYLGRRLIYLVYTYLMHIIGPQLMERYLEENKKSIDGKFIKDDDVHFGCSGRYSKFINKEMKLKMQKVIALLLDSLRENFQRIQDPQMGHADSFCTVTEEIISGKRKVVAVDPVCVANKKAHCHDECEDRLPVENGRRPYRVVKINERLVKLPIENANKKTVTCDGTASTIPHVERATFSPAKLVSTIIIPAPPKAESAKSTKNHQATQSGRTRSLPAKLETTVAPIVPKAKSVSNAEIVQRTPMKRPTYLPGKLEATATPSAQGKQSASTMENIQRPHVAMPSKSLASDPTSYTIAVQPIVTTTAPITGDIQTEPQKGQSNSGKNPFSDLTTVITNKYSDRIDHFKQLPMADASLDNKSPSIHAEQTENQQTPQSGHTRSLLKLETTVTPIRPKAESTKAASNTENVQILQSKTPTSRPAKLETIDTPIRPKAQSTKSASNAENARRSLSKRPTSLPARMELEATVAPKEEGKKAVPTTEPIQRPHVAMPSKSLAPDPTSDTIEVQPIVTTRTPITDDIQTEPQRNSWKNTVNDVNENSDRVKLFEQLSSLENDSTEKRAGSINTKIAEVMPQVNEGPTASEKLTNFIYNAAAGIEEGYSDGLKHMKKATNGIKKKYADGLAQLKDVSEGIQNGYVVGMENIKQLPSQLRDNGHITSLKKKLSTALRSAKDMLQEEKRPSLAKRFAHFLSKTAKGIVHIPSHLHQRMHNYFESLDDAEYKAKAAKIAAQLGMHGVVASQTHAATSNRRRHRAGGDVDSYGNNISYNFHGPINVNNGQNTDSSVKAPIWQKVTRHIVTKPIKYIKMGIQAWKTYKQFKNLRNDIKKQANDERMEQKKPK